MHKVRLGLMGAAVCALSLVMSTRAADLDATLAAAMAGTKVPAMSVLVMRDGKVAETAVRGVRRNDRAEPATLNDVWHIGSDAKPMTATLITRLVDRHVLAWNTPLARMFPELAESMRPEYRSVTLIELLTHRAGLAHDVADVTYFNAFFNDTRPLSEQRHDYIAHALQEAPIAPPGTKVSYSNTGFIIAAVIAERATGMSYEALMQREVFDPLGITHVGFGLPPQGSRWATMTANRKARATAIRRCSRQPAISTSPCRTGLRSVSTRWAATMARASCSRLPATA